MMKYSSFLWLLFLLTFCDRADRTDVSKETTSALKVTPYTDSLSSTAEEPVITDDPMFVETSDTVSVYGPQSITRNILQDKNGDIWFASWQGIMKYDGKVFTNMTLKERLRHFHVFSILEDHTGGLWFGMIGGGLYHYDGNFFTYYTTANGLAGNNVTCIMEDSSGQIWFGTNAGLSCLNTSGGQTFRNYTRKDGLLDNTIWSMLQDHTGKLWFGTEGGVNSCLNASAELSGKSSVKFIKEDVLPFRHVLSIIEDKSGRIWLGSQVGLSCYNPLTKVIVGEKSVNRIYENFTPNIFEDNSGDLWLSSGEPNSSKMILFRCNTLEAIQKGSKAFTKITSETQVFGVTQDRNEIGRAHV